MELAGERILWKTREGEYLHFSEMQTTHLFYSLRMLWNHSVPEEVRIEPFQRYAIGMLYSRKLTKIAIEGLSLELSKRTDLPEDLQIQLKYMIDNAASLRKYARQTMKFGGTYLTGVTP